MDGDLLKATGIDFLGIILMVVDWWQFAYTGFDMDTTLFAAGFLFPLAAYVVTYKYFRNQFWKAFFLSFGLGVLLLFLGMAVFMGVPV